MALAVIREGQSLASFYKEWYTTEQILLPNLQTICFELQHKCAMTVLSIVFDNIEVLYARNINPEQLVRDSIDNELEQARYWRARGMRKDLYKSLRGLALLIWIEYLRLGKADYDDILPVLEEMEEIYRTLCNDRTIATGWIRYNALLALNERDDDIGPGNFRYDCAISACLEAMNGKAMRRLFCPSLDPESCVVSPHEMGLKMRELIKWTQRKKARTLSRMLGSFSLSGLLPSLLTYATGLTEAAKSLLKEEISLRQRLSNASYLERPQLQDNLSSVYDQMRQEPTLASWMSLYDGSGNDLPGLMRNLAENDSRDTYFVDFVHLGVVGVHLGVTGASEADFLILVYQNGEIKKMRHIWKLREHELRRWLDDQLDEHVVEALGDSESFGMLRALDVLLEPLNGLTKPGDLIVFSPTQQLHRVPLHALMLEDKVLIERNPVAYCQSLSIFQQCRMLARLTTEKAFRSLYVDSLSELEGEGHLTHTIAKQIHAQVLQGSGLNKEKLLASVTDVALLHYHGHVKFSESLPLDHKFDIRGEESLTAQEIFDIRLRRGAHVTLIGCQSGRAQISDRDDLLGLCTAFHQAGASSTISTLWPIDREDGEAFSSAFYEDIIAQVAENSDQSKPVDLARAVRKAVLDLQKSEDGSLREPYHWAGFVLHGYPKSLQMSKGLASATTLAEHSAS